MPTRVWIWLDDRLSRDRFTIVQRFFQSLKQAPWNKRVTVEIIPKEWNEAEALALLDQAPTGQKPTLLLIPGDKYLPAIRLEGALGLNRRRGTEFAGYFGEAQKPEILKELHGRERLILLDFSTLTAGSTVEQVPLLEWIVWLATESERAGLEPLIEGPLWADLWTQDALLSQRLDSIFFLPEFQTHGWKKRATQVRALWVALWGMLYEVGPARNDLGGESKSSHLLRAEISVGVKKNRLAVQMRYRMPGFSPKELMAFFMDHRLARFHPVGELFRASDFLRVVLLGKGQGEAGSAASGEIEITTGLNSDAHAPSEAPSSKLDRVKTLWLSQVSTDVLPEPTARKLLKQAPVNTVSNNSANETKMKKLLMDASLKMKDLFLKLEKANLKINELRSGGVGVEVKTEIPDLINLREALELRIEQEIDAHPDPSAANEWKKTLTAWIKKEEEWLKKL